MGFLPTVAYTTTSSCTRYLRDTGPQPARVIGWAGGFFYAIWLFQVAAPFGPRTPPIRSRSVAVIVVREGIVVAAGVSDMVSRVVDNFGCVVVWGCVVVGVGAGHPPLV